ncbi:hypothetical protein DFH06DRAFT_1144161 [Mycena polygramma]|nr:hypothetical protein DFH06DRAFT_1144161 [Mycena polygramma]
MSGVTGESKVVENRGVRRAREAIRSRQQLVKRRTPVIQDIGTPLAVAMALQVAAEFRPISIVAHDSHEVSLLRSAPSERPICAAEPQAVLLKNGIRNPEGLSHLRDHEECGALVISLIKKPPWTVHCNSRMQHRQRANDAQPNIRLKSTTSNAPRGMTERLGRAPREGRLKPRLLVPNWCKTSLPEVAQESCSVLGNSKLQLLESDRNVTARQVPKVKEDQKNGKSNIRKKFL